MTDKKIPPADQGFQFEHPAAVELLNAKPEPKPQVGDIAPTTPSPSTVRKWLLAAFKQLDTILSSILGVDEDLENDIEELVDSLSPVAERYSGKIPPWAWFIVSALAVCAYGVRKFSMRRPIKEETTVELVSDDSPPARKYGGGQAPDD